MRAGRASRYVIAAAALLALAAAVARFGHARPVGPVAETRRAPRIRPDYRGIVLPPNIAPLNFAVEEPGNRCFARVSGEQGKPIEVEGRDGAVRIPLGSWRALLRANRGRELRVDVYTQDAGGRWAHFETIRNRVANEPIDGYLVYRRLRPTYNKWGRLGIYQRDLSSFRETPILRNTSMERACINCHTPMSNRPDTFLFQLRVTGGTPAMVLVRNGTVRALDTRAPQRAGAATYCAWHPSGKLIAFSANKIRQFFHTAGCEPRDVVDLDSGLAIYRVDSEQFEDVPVLNQPRRLETFPTWSPDGRTLYFASAPTPWEKPRPFPADLVDRVHYDIVRVPFDLASGRWGAVETVVPSAGRSVLEPRVSPDGRFLLVTMCDYGAFPVFQEHSDLFLVDLSKKGFPCRRLEPGRESFRDSWHTWSSNGRWVVFSRKKEYGVVARPYLRYIDAEGNPSRAFPMPQDDPSYYDRCYETFNAPELATGPVRIPEEELARAALQSQAQGKP